jgi:hypothetical protein
MIAATACTLVLAAGWVVVVSFRGQTRPHRTQVDQLLTAGRPFPPDGRFPGDPYIGSSACAPCHPGESALHARSGHAMTMRPASQISLARRLDGASLADPEHEGVHWSFRFDDGHLHLARAEPSRVERWIVEYAFGSGHHATTFVNVLDAWAPRILEHRMTYYTADDALDVTPGHSRDTRTMEVKPYGKELTPQNSRKCFGCHSTELAARGDQPIPEATMIPNVTCERCHGPARAHVAAARRGARAAELALALGPGRWTAESLMKLCGTCHRHPSRAQPGQIRPDDPRLARFQPVGILESRCYRASGGTFSCVSCHDPHARASGDRASYNVVCLSCHGTPTSERPAAAEAATQPVVTPANSVGLPCPRSPRGNCVDCHMSRVDSGQHILFTDHWIRVRQPGAAQRMRPQPPSDLDLFDPPHP